MKFAYADPPYIGQAKRYYSHDPKCAEVDHKELIERLVREYPDGWALSLSSPTLREILNYCPEDVRVAAWCKSFCAFKRGVRPAYAWEPVIYWRGRNPGNGHKHLPPEKNGKQTTPKDFIVEPITLKKGLVGAKPEKVCRWILQLLNAQPGDTVDDLFPGTGIMGRVASEVTEEKEDHMSNIKYETDGWADSQTGGQWPTPTAPPDELAQAKAMARKVGYGSGSLASVIENLAELAATARRALDDLVKMRSVCRNPNHALADGTPHLHEIGPSCMVETPAQVEYWKSRAETAELKVLTFHEEIVKLRGEQKV